MAIRELERKSYEKSWCRISVLKVRKKGIFSCNIADKLCQSKGYVDNIILPAEGKDERKNT